MTDAHATVYPGVDKTVEYIVESTAAQREVLDIHWPISDDELVARFEDGIKAINASGKRRVRLAVFDTISSMPGMRVPYERLAQICRKLNVLSLVDGAHGVGQIPLDLKALDADFVTSNVHKYNHRLQISTRGSAHIYQMVVYSARMGIPSCS